MTAKTLLATAGLSLLLGLGTLSAAGAVPFAPAGEVATAPVQTVQYYGYHHRRYYPGAALRREGWYPGQGLRRALAYRARWHRYHGY